MSFRSYLHFLPICHLNHASFSSYDGGSTAPLTVREASISSSYSLFAEFFYTRESTSIDVARECCCGRGKGDFFFLSPFLGPERSARVLLFDVSPSRTDRAGPHAVRVLPHTFGIRVSCSCCHVTAKKAETVRQ